MLILFKYIDYEEKGAVTWANLKVALFPEWSTTEISNILQNQSIDSNHSGNGKQFVELSTEYFDFSLLHNDDSSKFNSISALREVYSGQVKLTSDAIVE